MLLTVSKRLEFSASRRLHRADWTNEQNRAAFGVETSARYGIGRNYVAWFVFTGEVNAATGMLVNISAIKERLEGVLHARFDHKFLNEDHPAFRDVAPTAENLARQLFAEVQPRFNDLGATLVACHLRETPERSATFYADQTVEGNYWLEFSAARQTMSPHLSEAENRELFGPAASPHGHGHHYRARFTARQDDLTHQEVAHALDSLRQELDHRNLNVEVDGLTNCPKTTESLAQYLHKRAAQFFPVQRVRLHERDDFFAEHWGSDRFYLGMRRSFSAAHRLHSAGLSANENQSLYGKCNNPRGHGHLYETEATIGGRYDERSGVLFDFVAFQKALSDGLQRWENKHLDLETDDFRDRPSTGENIVRALWPRLNEPLDGRLVRLRLWETSNNRFTLRTL